MKIGFVWSWRSLFTPAGRLPRLPYFLTGLVYFVTIASMANFVPRFLLSPTRAYYVVTFPAFIFLYFLIYCLYSKRIQDIGAPGWLGSILVAQHLIFHLAFIYSILWSSDLYMKLSNLWDSGGSALNGALGIGHIILLFVPGVKTSNIYGPDPRKPVSPANLF